MVPPLPTLLATGLPADPYRMLYGQSWPNLSTRAELDSVRRLHARTWVLWTFPRYLERYAPEIDHVLHDDCTSRQVFRGLDLGSGKITKEEMRGVPHHLIDVREPNEFFSMADFQMLAYEAIEGIRARGPRVWIARASSPLPVPLSPVMRTVASVGATLMMRPSTSRTGAERPTMFSNL